MSNELIYNCRDNKPLKSLFIYGDKDSAFLVNGDLVNPLKQSHVRGYHIGIEKTLEYWKERNSCEESHLSKKLNKYSEKWGKLKDDETEVFVYDYKNCKAKLCFYDVKGGGHRWPDKDASNRFLIRKTFKLGNASHEINSAHEIIWFFGLIKVN